MNDWKTRFNREYRGCMPPIAVDGMGLRRCFDDGGGKKLPPVFRAVAQFYLPRRDPVKSLNVSGN